MNAVSLSVSSFDVVVLVSERVGCDSSTIMRCFYRVCIVICSRLTSSTFNGSCNNATYSMSID